METTRRGLRAPPLAPFLGANTESVPRYDLLKVTNQHIITPEGWAHTQNNRKYVHREGKNKSLCIETGLNTYKRITNPDEFAKEDFAAAKAYWEKTAPFWAEVRFLWKTILGTAEGPIHYKTHLKVGDKQNLMTRINGLAESFTKSPSEVTSKEIATVLGEHLCP